MNTPLYVDTHAHVQMPEFDADRGQVLERMRSEGVQWIVCPGVDLATSTLASQLAQQESDVVAAIGVHPEDCDQAPADYLAQLHALYATHAPHIAAIGEIGLDFKEGTPDASLQMRFFEEQLQLAADLSLPVIVHSRFAVTACLDAMAHFPAIRGVMHCFGGTPVEVDRAVGQGLHISFTGNITYPGAHATRDALKACPVERLLLETDSPYMTPVPMRGKRNEPSFVGRVYKAAAELLDTELEELCRRFQQTAQQLFNHRERGNHAGEEKL